MNYFQRKPIVEQNTQVVRTPNTEMKRVRRVQYKDQISSEDELEPMVRTRPTVKNITKRTAPVPPKPANARMLPIEYGNDDVVPIPSAPPARGKRTTAYPHTTVPLYGYLHCNAVDSYCTQETVRFKSGPGTIEMETFQILYL